VWNECCNRAYHCKKKKGSTPMKWEGIMGGVAVNGGVKGTLLSMIMKPKTRVLGSTSNQRAY
jgi:hypothetical protein